MADPMNDLIGIDSLHLYIEDFSIDKSRHNFTVQPSPIRPNGYLSADYPLWDGQTGQKAYSNDDICQVTLSAKEDHVPKLFMQCSIPKVAQGKNYFMVDREKTIEAKKILQSHLAEIGINTNLDAAKLSRADMTRNNYVPDPVVNYLHSLENAYAMRMERTDYETTGLLFRNTQQQICIYDKNELLIKENKDLPKGKRVDDPIGGLPTNCLRIETRLLGGEKIKSATGLRTFADLLTADGYHAMQENYLKTLKKNVFSFKPARVDADRSGELRQRAEYMKAMYGRNFEMYLSAMYGTPQIVEQYGLETYINTILDVADLSPNARKVRKTRMKKQIRDRQTNYGYLKGEMIGGRSAGELYIELRQMALRKVA